MELWQFRQLVEELGDGHVGRFLGVSPATLRRWKTGQSRIPQSAILALRLHLDGDLSALGGDDWAGFRLVNGQFFIPGWRNGWTPGNLCALFFNVQELPAIRSELKQARTALQEAKAATEMERYRAEQYRALAARQMEMMPGA
jgi:hypothetical protein